MSKHTPGPWINDEGTIKGPESTMYALVGEVYYSHCDDGQANAALIAAAPDMLAALEYVKAYFRETRHGQEWLDQGGCELDTINAAIRKAKGE